MLREARETLGLNLTQVAESTRIRLPFLEAIEAGRFDNLPGSAYAPAFLRGYAACVGLDVDRVMQVYRSGDAPVVAPVPAHQFPLVAPERRMPRGTMLVVSAVLLVCAYMTWHTLTRDQVPQDARVPPVPQRLLADQKPAASPGEPSTSPAPAAATPAPSAPAVAAAPPAAPATPPPSPATTAAPATASAPAPASAPVASVPAVPVPQPPSTGTTPDPQLNAANPRPPRTEPASPQTAAAAPPVIAPPAPAARPAPTPARRPDSTATTGDSAVAPDADPTQGNRIPSRSAPPPASEAQPAQQAAVPPASEPKPAAKPRTISAPAAAQPRTVRAEVNSTLELRGPTGEVLATTYMHAGSTYTVPEYVGYVLTPASR
ncbi:helix-turn-helix transcriptional regulator [Reyranella sp. CPCC 100927]|uniref:helix-turn-helix domain-containing protein n=1 Tax=Reyranella sp. CPCC 100927 TaxID=2599616 RepID=UPI0015B64390|nr:helix-turn-helix transcriptional regulator [Reyranella sp. CPCC 100927]